MNDVCAIFADMDEPLVEVLDPGIYVEPKDKDPADEDKRQIRVVARIRRDAKRITVHATPNGGRQSDWARLRGERMGVYSGWPDLTFDWNSGEAHVEMKDGTSKPHPDQIACLNRLHRMGKRVAVCRSAQGVWDWLQSVGAPIPA